MIDEAQRVIEQFRSLEEEMALPETTSDPKRLRALGQQHARLGRAAELARDYLRLRDDIEEWSAAARGDDPDFAAEARRELLTLEARQEPLERELQLLLVPRDPADDGSCMVELRAGTGGDEACLFAGELARMYQRYAEGAGWRMTLMDATEGTVGGFREAVFQVEGTGAYGRLKFESGVHRVQRVPATEAQGRIHTSAASVVVLPEADEDVEITINPADLRIDTYRASGAGGQHINKTDSAVRMTHMPTGIVVSCQTERSQLQNRENCLKMLRAKLYDAKVQERVSQEEATRRSQVGSGDRSAKIRTFNYPQNRVTDHRINLTLYKLEAVLGGDLNELLDALQLADAMAKLGQV